MNEASKPVADRSTRRLGLGFLRAFEAVARRLSFSAAATELHLTQSAISRQIKSLEDELRTPLFTRGTRHVVLTAAGQALQRAVDPSLDRIDAAVRQIRSARSRRHVSVSTFASFASLWLLPRLQAFQTEHPDIDIRISASDQLTDTDDPDIDFALRYCHPDDVPADAERLFGEILTPVISPRLREHIQRGEAPALQTPADLANHALMEEDDHRPSAEYLSWRTWLRQHGLPQLEPRRWIYLNYTYQQVQGAIAGQGVALARVSMVTELLESGELVEPFGPAGRTLSPYAYWLVPFLEARHRDHLRIFRHWVQSQGEITRRIMGESPPIT